MEKIDHAAKAKENFLQGYNCSQSVIKAFEDMYDMDSEQLLMLCSPFGGGMGRLREVCGTVSGMFMVLGILYGYKDPKDFEGKKELYARVQELAGRFREQNGSIVCRELLGLDHKSDVSVPEKRTEEYYKKRPCPDLCACAAGILEKYIEENPIPVKK
ncbi:C-GCAxxG-C-C family protein [Lachnospiraceae bacterium C1.1]|nr:C-GCAxxG-C-C family protein [Lachnospiraceae bacterium C1.1]